MDNHFVDVVPIRIGWDGIVRSRNKGQLAGGTIDTELGRIQPTADGIGHRIRVGIRRRHGRHSRGILHQAQTGCSPAPIARDDRSRIIGNGNRDGVGMAGCAIRHNHHKAQGSCRSGSGKGRSCRIGIIQRDPSIPFDLNPLVGQCIAILIRTCGRRQRNQRTCRHCLIRPGFGNGAVVAAAGRGNDSFDVGIVNGEDIASTAIDGDGAPIIRNRGRSKLRQVDRIGPGISIHRDHISTLGAGEPEDIGPCAAGHSIIPATTDEDIRRRGAPAK